MCCHFYQALFYILFIITGSGCLYVYVRSLINKLKKTGKK